MKHHQKCVAPHNKLVSVVHFGFILVPEDLNSDFTHRKSIKIFYIYWGEKIYFG